MTSSQAVAQLKEFGVSANAARAYLALLALGVAEARGVSELASVPPGKVYGALVQLQKRGLAEVTPGKPRKYAPVPIESFVQRQLREQEERAGELRDRMDAIVELFPRGPSATMPERPQTVTIEGKRNVMQHLREASHSAQTSIHAVVSASLRADLALRRPFEEAAIRGVDVRLMEDPLPAADAAAADSGSLLATFDERAALLIRLGRGPRRVGRSSSAIHTTDAGFVGLLRRMLVAAHGPRTSVEVPPAPPDLRALTSW